MSKRPEFDRYTCNGDSISWMVDGYLITARIEHDDNTDPPDQRQDGFWPSNDPHDAGFIGWNKSKMGKDRNHWVLKSKKTLLRHTQRAHEIMEAWKADQWFYCGVCVRVSFDDVELTGKYDHALWGVECNYPIAGRGRKVNPNKYLGEVARELAQEALKAARAKLDSLQEKCNG